MNEPNQVIVAQVDLGQISADIQREHIALQETDRKLIASEERTDSLRKQQAMQRIELGRLLIGLLN